MIRIESTRNAYGETIKEFGKIKKNIVVLDADLSCCVMTCYFAESYPEREFNMGVAECNMVVAGAGMATTGKIVFVNSFAMFTAGRAYDQIRNSVAYPRLNVKIVGTHAGLSNGEDGATHQCIEDIALMRAIPGMTVLSPCDSHETRCMVEAMIEYNGPCFMRLGRSEHEIVTDKPGYKFEIGKGIELAKGKDLTIIATGPMVQIALKAREILETNDISTRVIDMHTIKPIDENIIIKAAKETGAIVTSEEHNILGGLGGAVAEVVAEKYPVPVVRNGIKDVFGRSGKMEDLMEKYGLTSKSIIDCAKKVLAMKDKN